MKRVIAAYVVAVAAVVWIAAAAPSAEPLAWIADHDRAVESARQQGRLLFVVHLSGDFTDNSPTSRPALVYASLALVGDEVREFLSTRCVLTYRHVGHPTVFAPQEPPGHKANHSQAGEQEFAIAYVCLPDERVLHFIPGFVSDKELLSELQFAEACYFDMLRFPGDEQAQAVREAHLAAARPAALEAFHKLVRVRADQRPKGAAASGLETAIAAARQVRHERLAQRLGMNWQAREFAAVAAALAGHAALENDAAHLVLSDHPLPALEQIQRPLYEAWSGQRFWKTRRYGDVRQWIALRSGKGRPMLLVVEGESPATSAKSAKDPLAWPLKTQQPLPYVEEFEVLTLCLDDLAAWLREKGLGPISHPAGHSIRYVVFGRSGQFVSAISQRDGVGKLISAMQAAGQTGETAAFNARSRE